MRRIKVQATDKQRLDWIEASQSDVLILAGVRSGQWAVVSLKSHKSRGLAMTVREAIDAAMSAALCG